MGRSSETFSSRWINLISPSTGVDSDITKKNLGAGAGSSRLTNSIYLALAAVVGLSAFIIELALVDLGGHLCFGAIIAVVILLSRIR